MEDKPTFISRDGMIADSKYVRWIADIKSRFQQSQIKAAVKVNTSLLEFYWGLGRDIVSMQAESKWGSGFFNQLSLDLREVFPQMTGFSSRNIRYMKDWYLFYYERYIVMRQAGAKTAGTNLHQVGAEFEFRQQTADEKSHQIGGLLEMPEIFGQVPWKHHVYIVSKCKFLDEALFYIDKVVKEGWSRSWLEDQIARNLYKPLGVSTYQLEEVVARTVKELEQQKE